MRITQFISILVSIGLTCFVTQSMAAPLNDNYVDRITLTGTDITFTGTLADATREEDPFEIVPNSISTAVSQTVWWEWTPTQSCTVVLQIISRPDVSERVDAVGVYRLQNIYTGDFVADLPIETRVPYNFTTFSAEAGTNYQIQLAGIDGATVSVRLIATNIPIIMEHPKSQAITAGDSVMFGVIVAGAKPFTYQWQRYGTNLVGETAAILGLDHVVTDQAGPYRVAVSNAAGVVFSQVAQLIVTPTDTAAALSGAPAQSNQFSLQVIGEIGRRYKVESSTNLMDWSEKFGFSALSPESLQPRSVIFNSTGADSFLLLRENDQEFFRAHPFHAINEECNNNLKKMRYAQTIILCETQLPTQTVALNDFAPYLKNGALPTCPAAGTYTVTDIQSLPACSLHPFEEP